MKYITLLLVLVFSNVLSQNKKDVKSVNFSNSIPKVEDNTTHIYDSAETEAEFVEGGINTFRSIFAKNFNTGIFKGNEGLMSSEITFIVERDGTLSDFKAYGNSKKFNNEAVRSIKSITGKWNPAKINGQPVRQRFRLPLKMNFK